MPGRARAGGFGGAPREGRGGRLIQRWLGGRDAFMPAM
jgi:hypothetical protein